MPPVFTPSTSPPARTVLPCLLCGRLPRDGFTSAQGYVKWFTQPSEEFFLRMKNYLALVSHCRQVRGDSLDDFLFLFHEGEVSKAVCFDCLKLHVEQLEKLLGEGNLEGVK